MPMPSPPRTTSLAPDTAAIRTRDPGLCWWAPLRSWPFGILLEDVPETVLAVERQHDRPLPLPEAPITCSARLCAEAPFAGLDIDLEGLAPPRATIRRRIHPLDRRAVGVAT